MADYSACDLVRTCALSPDAKVWDEFLRRFGGRIREGIYRAIRKAGVSFGGAELEDLQQNVYCKLLDRECRNLRHCRGREDREVCSYLCRIAETVTFDYLRAAAAAKRGRNRILRLPPHRQLELDERAVDPGISPEEELLRRERRRIFLRCCGASLGPRSRERNLRVLYLAFLEGLSSREISQRVQGATPSCVDSLVHRVRKRMARGGLAIPHRRRR